MPKQIWSFTRFTYLNFTVKCDDKDNIEISHSELFSESDLLASIAHWLQ